MEIEREAGQLPDVTKVKLNGPLTLATLFPLQTLLRGPELKDVIIDFSGVPYMDSAGLGVLLSHWAHCQRVGTRMALAGVSQRVRTIFEITHTDTMMSFFATADEAENASAKSATE